MDEPQGDSVHDHRLVSSEVHCERREMRLRTEFRDRGESFEFTDAIFAGVAWDSFEQDPIDGTILFEIEEVDASAFSLEHSEQLRDGVRYGWPGKWAASFDEAAAYFQRHGIRRFLLASSCGMCGWVLALSMKMVTGINTSAK